MADNTTKELKMAEAKKTTKKQVKAKADTEISDSTVVATDTLVNTADTPQETAEVVEQNMADQSLAKSGKRSAKALKEAEEKEAKEARKASAETLESESKPKRAVTLTRSRLERRGKHFRKSAELIEAAKLYSLEEAVSLAQKTSHVKFDATVEFHINLGVDPRVADQNIRDTLILPAGTGKKIRIAVLTDDAVEAKNAGADIAGTDELLNELEKGNLNFDILIATPALMAKLGKYARVLGPRGLMPSPKSGTVTTDVNKAVAEAKAGKVEYRVDSTGIIHLGVGKVSFTAAQLLENVQAVIASIKSNKPNSIKGIYLKSAHITTTMGPSISVDINSVA
jgi:large subunit ribosomal protein L1